MIKTTTAHYNAAERELKELAKEADGDTTELLQAAAVAHAIVFAAKSGRDKWKDGAGTKRQLPHRGALRRLAFHLRQEALKAKAAC